MKPPELGNPRLEYRPLPASPIAIAVLMIMLVVAAVGLPAWVLSRGSVDLWWLWLVPPLLIIGAMVLAKPRPLRIYDRGLELPLPLWQGLLGFRRAYTYDEVVNVYPRLYYVAGALLSPFAASVGTVEHLGLGLELKGGRETVLRFTPSVPRFAKGQEEGYRIVAQELRSVYADLGRTWVTDVAEYSEEEIDSMKRAAARPLMPFHVISVAFFSPVALIPLLYVGLTSLGIALTPPVLAGIVLAGILPMAAMLATSWKRSRRRHHYLREISKFTEWMRATRAANYSNRRPPPPRDLDGG